MAKGRVTPDIERWVLWELPFSRALAYQHCHLRANGQWTVPLGKPLAVRMEEMMVISSTISNDDDGDGDQPCDPSALL